MSNSDHAAPIVRTIGRAARLPVGISSISHLLVTRADSPCLPVAACGARGPFSRPLPKAASVETASMRYRDSVGDEWILKSCLACFRAVDAGIEKERNE